MLRAEEHERTYMPNVVIFWGHGSFDPTEVPRRATIPDGCRLCSFTRHNEEIDGTRMSELSHWITYHGVQALEQQADLLARVEFRDEMTKNNHLRRVKVAGESVHNYRLFPPTGLTTNTIEGSSQAVKIVTAQDPDGETLASLFAANARPGRIFMWVACRVVEGNEGMMVDDYGAPAGVKTFTVGDDRVGHFFHREDGYFKKHSKKDL